MSNASEVNGCPLCDKPVMGRTALLGHLEFGHDIADPEAYLASLEQPAPSRRGRGGAALGRRAAVLVVLAAVVGVAVLGAQQLLADDATVSADDGAAADPVTTTSVAPAPTTAATTPSSTSTTTTVAPATTAAPAEDVAFRPPFALEPEVTGCTRAGDVAVHEFRVRFSGALNITFDGVFYPDDSGNGVRTSTHELPAGASTYLDQLVVTDPSGGEHEVELSPPLYLAGC